ILALWVATALVYPLLHRFAVWLVDDVILDRADYAKLQAELARAVESTESIPEVLDTICGRLATVLTAGKSGWAETTETEIPFGFALVNFTPNDARMLVPTAESPQFVITLTEFQGGRRLLSDEIAVLKAISL